MIDFDRRDFLKTAAAAAAATATVGSAAAFASDSPSLAGIVYTKEQPGQWKGKEGGHAPEVKIEGSKVSVVTNHPSMTAEHMIVRHTVVLADGKVLGAKNFAPGDKAESSFELPAGYKGKVCATSFCNLHDLWMTEATV